MKIDSRVLLDWTEKYYREHARKAKEEGLAWSADEARLRAFCDTRHQWELLYGTWDGGGWDDEEGTLRRMGDATAKYNDKCIYAVAQAVLSSEGQERGMLFIDSQTKETSSLPPATVPITTVVAPVHRPDHWVFYGVRRREGVEMFFADSKGGRPRVNEIRRLEILTKRSDPSFPEMTSVVIKRLPCPSQQDDISCGVFATEALRRFVNKDLSSADSWPDPVELRRQHAEMVNLHKSSKGCMPPDAPPGVNPLHV